MKLRDVGLCLLGGSILYVSMAACAGRPSGSSGTRGTTSGGGSGGVAVHNGGAGGTTGSGGVIDSGIGDALTDPVSSANAEPGSRLKRKFRDAEDGAREFLTGVWWDSQRQEDCSFTLAADGKMRCLPPGNEFRYFADAQCNTPMVMMQGACSPPKYGTSATEAACGLDAPSTHVFAIGGPTSPAMIYGKSGSACFAIGPTTPDWQYFSVGAEIPANSFVAATVGHE